MIAYLIAKYALMEATALTANKLSTYFKIGLSAWCVTKPVKQNYLGHMNVDTVIHHVAAVWVFQQTAQAAQIFLTEL